MSLKKYTKTSFSFRYTALGSSDHELTQFELTLKYEYECAWHLSLLSNISNERSRLTTDREESAAEYFWWTSRFFGNVANLNTVLSVDISSQMKLN